MISALWEPIQKYIDTLETLPRPPALHHYTSVRSACGILETGRMWFTERTHLNDPTEISYGIEIARDELRRQGMNADATNLTHTAKRIFDEFRFFSASFSLKYDDLSQWRDYADDGKGIILSLKASSIHKPKDHIDRFIKDIPTAFVCPMSYKPADLRAVISLIIAKWNRSDPRELFDHVFMISSMFKHDCWASEKEYRFFVHHKRDEILKSSHYKTRERNGQIVSYLDLPIQNWSSSDDFPIYRISIGPAAPDGLRSQLTDFLLSKGIEIKQICSSELPYRSSHVP